MIGNDIPTKDSVIEFRFKLGGAQSVTADLRRLEPRSFPSSDPFQALTASQAVKHTAREEMV